MAIRIMSFDESEALLTHSRIGRLAIQDPPGVYVVPTSFVYRDNVIYAHAAPGHKLVLMREWPHVTLLVDDIKTVANWRSVMVRGRWNELEDKDEKTRARMLLLNAFEGDIWWATAGHGNRTTLEDAILYKIEIDELSGRAQD